MQRKGFSRDQIRLWVQFNAKRSEYIARQAKIYGYTCYDIGTIGYMDAQKMALESITNDKEYVWNK